MSTSSLLKGLPFNNRFQGLAKVVVISLSQKDGRREGDGWMKREREIKNNITKIYIEQGVGVYELDNHTTKPKRKTTLRK